MTPSAEESPTAQPPARHAVVVAELVDAARLIQEDEASVLQRWQRLLDALRDHTLPAQGGRLLKCLGDALLLEFPTAAQALAAARDLHRRLDALETGPAPGAVMALRAGLHLAEVDNGALDLFGEGVDVAARLAALAPAGGILVSGDAADALIPALDASLHDLGELEPGVAGSAGAPLRAFGASLEEPTAAGRAVGDDVTRSVPAPVIAVFPFNPDDAADPLLDLAGDALADHLIGALSHGIDRCVVARESTAQLRGCSPAVAHEQLGAQVIVRGRCRRAGGALEVDVEVVDAPGGRVRLSRQARLEWREFFAGGDAAAAALARDVARAAGVSAAPSLPPLPATTPADYALLRDGCRRMHRLGRLEFARARESLAQCAQRAPGAAAPLSMLAKWHLMRFMKDDAVDRRAEAVRAQAFAERALRADRGQAIALYVDGLVAMLGRADLAFAQASYEAALAADPQEPCVWTALSGLYAARDDGPAAVAAARRAIALSPLDPLRFVADTQLALALTLVDDFGGAIAAAQRSIRLHRALPASHRVLAVAHALDGDLEAARTAVANLRTLQPGLTLGTLAARYPGRTTRAPRHLARHLDALRAAGLPD